MLRARTAAILPDGARGIRIDQHTARVRQRRSRDHDEPGADPRPVLQSEPAASQQQPCRELSRGSLHGSGGVFYEESEADGMPWLALLHEALAKGRASPSKKVRLASPSRWREPRNSLPLTHCLAQCDRGVLQV